ncbi:MAG: hypothetical protein ACOYD4_15655 [Solirubrobacterales bacterium]
MSVFDRPGWGHDRGGARSPGRRLAMPESGNFTLELLHPLRLTSVLSRLLASRGNFVLTGEGVRAITGVAPTARRGDCEGCRSTNCQHLRSNLHRRRILGRSRNLAVSSAARHMLIPPIDLALIRE